MRILVICNHYAVCSGRYITEAFQALGHEVRHVGGQKRLQDAWGVATPEKYEWQCDMWSASLDDFKPDLAIIADSDPLLLEGWGTPIPAFTQYPIIVFGVDNHVRNYRRPNFAHYFLAHNFGPAQPVTKTDETWLPCATSAEHFPPSPIAWQDREYDVCCVGVMYPNRTYLLDTIEAAGFKVFRGTGLLYDEYAAAYHNSRVSLCVSAAGDVAQRIFETAGMGCAVLTDVLKDLDHWKTNKALGLNGFMVYQSQTDARDCIRLVRDAIIEDSGLVQHGAKAMQAIVLQNHTWKRRAQVIVNWFEREFK